MHTSVSQKLYELRMNSKESQEAVAKAVGISRVAYTRYENGSRRPEADIAIKLARHFGVTVDFLYGMTDTTETKNQPTVKDDELKEALVSFLVDLTPSEIQRVRDFVAGIKANRREDAAPQE